ncbi:hypothetical protein EMIT048CA2_70070 [Pseudomonas chlororaphis]
MTRTRTWDPMINSHLLYRLSYHGTEHFNLQLLQQAFISRSLLVDPARIATFVSLRRAILQS